MATKKEKVVEVAKTIGSIVCSGGAEAFICGIGRAILPPGVNAIVKGGMLVGGLLIGGYLGDKASEYVDGSIDKTVKECEDTAKEIKRCLDVLQDKDEEPEQTE